MADIAKITLKGESEAKNFIDEALRGDIAYEELSTTVSKAGGYVAGDHLIYLGQYYEVVADIAQGGTIVTSGAGQNVEEREVGDEIKKNKTQVVAQIETLTSALTNNVNVNGCKNLFLVDLEKIISTNKGGTWNGNTFTQKGATYTINDNDSVTFGGTPTDYTQIVFPQNVSKADKYMLSGLSGCTNVVFGGCSMYLNDTLVSSIVINSKQNTELDLSSYTFDRITIDVKRAANNTAMSGTAFIMLCLKSDWDLDQTYVPPTKTNRQLTKETTGLLDNLEVNGAVNMLPNIATSQTINSVEWTVNSDGTVQAYVPSGTTTSAESNLIIATTDKMNALLNEYGEIKVVGCPAGGSDMAGGYGIRCKQGSKYPRDNGKGIILKSSNGTVNVGLSCNVRENTTGPKTLLFKPMIGLVSTPNFDYEHYVPYAKSNKQLTQDSVTWDDLSEVGAVNYCNFDIASGTKKGYTFTNDNGVIHVTGSRATGETGNVDYRKDMTLKAGTYRVSGCPSGGGTTKWRLLIAINNSTQYAVDYGDGAVFTLAADSDDVKVYCTIMANYSDSVDMYYKPMITPVSYNGPYVPYAKTNKELTEELTVKNGEITRLVSFSSLTSYRVKKYGKVVELFFAGTLSEAVNIWTDFLTVPDGFRPSHYVQIVSFNTYNSCKNLQLAPSGGIQSAYNLASGDYIRFTVTYIID